MIQDIAPHIYDNQFTDRRPPKKTDLLLIYQKNQILLHEKARKQKVTMLPEVGNLPLLPGPDGKVSQEAMAAANEIEEKAAGIYSFRGFDLIYVFSIDDTAFFSIDEMQTDLSGFEWTPTFEIRNLRMDHLSFAAITGGQLFRWRQDHHYCGRCGHPMKTSSKERAFVCPECHSTVYPKISPAVIVAITNGDKLLVSQYAGRGPSKSYAMIAGFAEVGETIEETVHREVLEEVGVKVKNLRFYKSQPWSFSDTLLMGFYCDLDGDDTIAIDQEELAMAKWLSREELPVRSNEISLTAEMMEEFRLGRQ